MDCYPTSELLCKVIDKTYKWFGVLPPKTQPHDDYIFFGMDKNDLVQETAGMKSSGPEINLVTIHGFVRHLRIGGCFLKSRCLQGILHVPRSHPAPPLVFITIILRHGVHVGYSGHPLFT